MISPLAMKLSTTALWRGYTARIVSIETPDGSPITTVFMDADLTRAPRVEAFQPHPTAASNPGSCTKTQCRSGGLRNGIGSWCRNQGCSLQSDEVEMLQHEARGSGRHP